MSNSTMARLFAAAVVLGLAACADSMSDLPSEANPGQVQPDGLLPNGIPPQNQGETS